MADLTNGSGVYQTYNNAGTGVSELGDNHAQNFKSNGIAGKTVIVKLEDTNMTDAELNSAIQLMTRSGGDGAGALASNQVDAFTVIGVEAFETGVTDSIHVAIQGTGDTSTLKASLENLAGVTTATVVATFEDRIVS
jgi:hypothetical protein